MIVNEAVDKYLFLLLILQKEYLLILQNPASITRSTHWVLTYGIDAPWKMTCLSRSLSLANSGMESPILAALGNGCSLVQPPSPHTHYSRLNPSISGQMLIEHSFLLKYLQLPHLGRILENMGKQKANVYFSLWKGVIWLTLKLTDGKGHWCADLPPLCPTPWKFVTSRVLCTKSHFLVFPLKRGPCPVLQLFWRCVPLPNEMECFLKTKLCSIMLSIIHCPSIHTHTVFSLFQTQTKAKQSFKYRYGLAALCDSLYSDLKAVLYKMRRIRLDKSQVALNSEALSFCWVCRWHTIYHFKTNDRFYCV